MLFFNVNDDLFFVFNFLGGRIDHAHHSNKAKRALTETVEFSEAVNIAKKLTNEKETLLVVTADHSHVFTMAGYPKTGTDILGALTLF